jgi:hypothetical protein
VCFTLLLSPYAPIYDAILVVAAVALLAGSVSQTQQRGVFCGWLLFLYMTPWITQSFAEFLHFQPLTIVLAGAAALLVVVLAVAGAARHHFPVMAAGLLLSVALMGVASNFVARLLARYPWLSWLGLLLVTSVALRMIYEGSLEVAQHATTG